MRYLMFVLLTLAALIAPTHAADFYKGKTLTLLINYPPGGPTDIEGRVIARHLAEHIPGKPTVIVKNMGGATGNTGANFLGEIAAKDGLTLGFFTWNPVDQILGAEGLRVKYNDFVFIAGVQQPTIAYARKDTPPGLAKEATEELRAAYRALWKNEAFMAEYEKTVKYRAGLIVGADGEKLIASLGQVKPELVAFLKDYTTAIAK